jgi:succinoglycan biosynthesis transport protein ExoP
VVLDILDPHIYTAADVEAVLGFAPIGMLFDDREVTQLVFDECALRLAAGVEHASRIAGARTFVITGVNSGAGTSTIVDSLGSMLAKLGRKTLVIDPSGASEPVAYVTFGSHLQKQPVDFSERSAAPSSAKMERQAALPAGAPLPSRVSPITSPVLQGFQAMTADYDIVLIDASPLLLSAETEYLARMADVTVLVSEAGKTKKAWLTRAARLLERLGVAGAAAVVNKVHPARIEEALKDDLREFELRSDRVNLEDWWKPKKKAAATASAEHFEKGEDHADEEDEVFARDI